MKEFDGMVIKEEKADLSEGTILITEDDEFLQLTSSYQEEGFYLCCKLEVDENGEFCTDLITQDFKITPVELIGMEVIPEERFPH